MITRAIVFDFKWYQGKREKMVRKILALEIAYIIT